MPNEFGDQHLYELTASFIEKRKGNLKRKKSIKIGFRTIELVQHETDPSQPEKGALPRKCFYVGTYCSLELIINATVHDRR